MNYIISGGTGFVGTKLQQKLHKMGHHTYVVTRTPDKKRDTKQTTYISYDHPAGNLPEIRGVINLAGESIFGYWSLQKREKILYSRYNATNNLLELVSKLDNKPEVFISGSAVGYYGTSESEIFTEESAISGSDFLAEVAVKWEQTAKKAEEMDIRTVFARFGVIIGADGGSFPLIQLPVKFFAGGKVGSGEQWMSWVHVNEVVDMIIFCLENEAISGPVNMTTPNPARNKDFMKQLSRSMGRPFWSIAPRPIVHAIMGEVGQLLTKGQYVLPKKLEEHGYEFKYPTLMPLFDDLLKKE